MIKADLEQISILGVKVHLITKTVLHQRVAEIIHTNQRAIILNVNAHAVNLTFNHLWLRNYFARADIVFSDGFGVIAAAKLLGHTIPERITYADWMWE
jgi:N-acetylglucosaminyldiphosphoundecaprenol N-acetyl-beta-D-mannosaminyltransferase